MLEIKNLSFSKDGKDILTDINLKINENEIVVITGPNGSGKTTLLKLIMGIEKPTSGKILFNSKDITDLEVEERAKLKLSYSFQEPVKFRGITVTDLLKISSGKELFKNDICNILSKVGLCAQNYENRYVDKTLSGGEAKRIEIATVLAKKSLLYLFDEPEAGIDLWSFNKLIKIFKELQDEENSLIIVSHQEKIMDIATKIVLLENGKIKDIGTKDILKARTNNTSCCYMGVK